MAKVESWGSAGGAASLLKRPGEVFGKLLLLIIF